MKKISLIVNLLCFSLIGVVIFNPIAISNKITHISNGNTYYVNDDGDEQFNTIRDALNFADDYDTIIVYSGFYQENLEISKSITLQGVEENNEGLPIIDGDKNDFVIKINADGVTISNFIIQNPAYDTANIIIYSGSNKILNNQIKCLDKWERGDGIHIMPSVNNNIEGNTISMCYAGVEILSSHFTVVKSNEILDNYYGVLISEEDKNPCCDNTIIEDNYIYNNDDGGVVIDCQKTSSNKIIGNTIEYSKIGINFCYSSYKSENNLIEGNTISKNPIGGVILNNLVDSTINNNNITENKNDREYNGLGLSLKSCNNNTISDNEIKYHYDINILLDHSDYNTLKNNILTFKTAFGIRLQSSIFNDIISNEIIDNNEYGICLEGSSCSNTIIENNISKNSVGLYSEENCKNNIIYHNNFYSSDFAYTSDFYNAKDKGENIWYSGELKEGNYWDDWAKNTGFYKIPKTYEIKGGDNVDHYPLDKPYGKSRSHSFNLFKTINFKTILEKYFPLLQRLFQI